MSATTLVREASRMNNIRFDEFYRLHRADAVRWATALVGSREVGEELAQDALQAVGRKLAGIDNPGGYLRRTVVNRCASWHRWHASERRRVRLATAGAATSYTAETNEMMDALATLPMSRIEVPAGFTSMRAFAIEISSDAIGNFPVVIR